MTGQETFILFIYHESCRSSSETLETTLRTSWCHYPEGNSLDVVLVHIFTWYFWGTKLGKMRWKRRGCKLELCRTFLSEDTWYLHVFFERHSSFIVYEACLFQEFLVHICPAANITLLHRKVSKCQPPVSKPTIHLLEIFAAQYRILVLKYSISLRLLSFSSYDISFSISTCLSGCTMCADHSHNFCISVSSQMTVTHIQIWKCSRS